MWVGGVLGGVVVVVGTVTWLKRRWTRAVTACSRSVHAIRAIMGRITGQLPGAGATVAQRDAAHR